MTTQFDAITLEVLWTRIISVVDEAAKAIVRTSFSTLSKRRPRLKSSMGSSFGVSSSSMSEAETVRAASERMSFALCSNT